MEKEHIVIVTDIDDPHADDVVSVLATMGHEPIRLNTSDVPLNTNITLAFDDRAEDWQGTIEILTNGRIIDAANVRSVWWRRPGAFGVSDDLSLQEREFAQGEIEHALAGLWASLDCYWISYPEFIRQARWKGGQLKRAAQLGFEVPRTLITTDPEDVRAFYEACNGKIIFKVMTDPYLGAHRVQEKHPEQEPEPYQTFTTMITETELQVLGTVRTIPCLFQEYVPKHLELRVTVIGDEVFAAEIHSQTHESSAVDWRRRALDVPYRAARLPDEVAERCLILTKSYGLNFSTMDLILTPDGRYVFVENNPNGQFIFVEELVPELRMTEALASCLVRAANG